jgi:diaminopimelate decarboxylase
MNKPATRRAKPHPLIDPVSFTPKFSWANSAKNSPGTEAIACEGVRLLDIVQRTGTPTYVYSQNAISQAYRELDSGLVGVPHTLCFAVKSNGNLSILKHLAAIGSGFDVVSGGELCHLQRIGVPGDHIVFSGVGKTREEMRQALRYPASRPGRPPGILLFNIESEAELRLLLEECERHLAQDGVAPSVSIRVNPDVGAGAHPHISTGRHEHKFGLDWKEARRLYLAHRHSKLIQWHGISVHIGSQIVRLDPFRAALRRLRTYVKTLQSDGIALRYLDFGGGLGVRYTNEKPPARQIYAKMIAQAVRPLGLHLLLEPGRTIIAPAGVLLTRVLYIKQTSGKTFVVVDAAMNDLLRPALYGAVHPISRVTRPSVARKNGGRQKGNGNSQLLADIVGPVCETGDCFLRDWPLGEVQPGDVLAIWVAGAYGMSLASNYNARCRPAEVLVEGERYRLIRRRETPDDLLRGDTLA